jgi:hypothetical protein
MTKLTLILLVLMAIHQCSACTYLRHLAMEGHGPGYGKSPGRLIQLLLDNHGSMERVVTHNKDGSIVSQTTSDDPAVAAMLQEHVAMMLEMVEQDRMIRNWDPFFVALVTHSTEFETRVANIDNGVQVTESASTPCGQALIDNHTAVVSRFVKTGRTEAKKSHTVPAACRHRQ